MSKKQTLAEYSFRPALVVAMREAFQKACKAPQVADGAPDDVTPVMWKPLPNT
jgi:hypothetical protein